NFSWFNWSCTIAGFDGSNSLIGSRCGLGMLNHALHQLRSVVLTLPTSAGTSHSSISAASPSPGQDDMKKAGLASPADGDALALRLPGGNPRLRCRASHRGKS